MWKSALERITLTRFLLLERLMRTPDPLFPLPPVLCPLACPLPGAGAQTCQPMWAARHLLSSAASGAAPLPKSSEVFLLHPPGSPGTWEQTADLKGCPCSLLAFHCAPGAFEPPLGVREEADGEREERRLFWPTRKSRRPC